MKLKIFGIAIILLLGFLILISISCDSESDCNSPLPNGEVFVFKLVDKKTNSNLIAAWGAKYESSKVDLLIEDGIEASNLEIGADGNISFIIPERNDEALINEVSKKFYIHLPDAQGSLSQDIDTLVFKYKFYEKEKNCPKIWYATFSASFNDSLYHSGEYLSYIEFKKSIK